MANYEGRVITALLKRKDMIAIMGEPISSMMISCQDIWQFILNYYQQNREVPEPSVVIDIFGADPWWEPELEGATKHHLEVLKAYSLRESTHELLKSSTSKLQSGELSPGKIVNLLSRRISELQRQMGSSRSIDIRDTDEALDHYNVVREKSLANGGQPGIPFGFKQMDDNYPTGMAPGDLGIVMGYSGKGKTWFAIKLLINAWLKGHSVAFINLEMSPEKLRDRVYFLISQYSMTDFAKAEIDFDNFRQWGEDFMKGKPEFRLIGNDDFGAFSVDMIHAKLEQYKPDIIGLDYLSLFTDRGRSENEISRMRNLSRELKQLAMATNIPILAIAAVTGKDKKDRVNAPDIAQVAWSSGIEYDADFAIAVHTHTDPKTQKATKTEIICRKNRIGSMYAFHVKMDLEIGTIEEMDDEEQMKLMLDNDQFSYLDDDKQHV